MHTKRTTGLSRPLCLLLALALSLSAVGCGRRKSAPAEQTPEPTAEVQTAPPVTIGGREYDPGAAEVTAVLAAGETE